jgi:NTE family protein
LSRITERKIWNYTPDGDVFRRTRNAASSWLTILHGQPGFFTPTHPSPWLSFPGARTATSYYDSAPLRETLLELVDFSLINQKETRLAVGAVNVLDGNFAYFDNALDTIEPAHVMASGALPRDIQDVMARHKDIVYSSRTRYNTDVYRRIHTWKTRLRDALQKVPADRLTDEERRLKDELADLPELSILQLIYQQKSYEGTRQGLRVLRNIDARALDRRIRRHDADAEASALDRDAAGRRRDRRPRRAPGRVTGTVSEAAATSSPAFRQSTS